MDMTALPAYATQLRWLDLLIEREIHRLRGRYQLSLDEFRGLYISDEQVDQLLNRGMPAGQSAPYIHQLTEQAEALHKAARLTAGPINQLQNRFGLSEVECDLLFLALAPELDAKYETLYAYLNDDVSRKWPTIQMAQRLMDVIASADTIVRAALSPAGALMRERLVILGERGATLRSSTSQGFALAPATTQFLLGLLPGNVLLSDCVMRESEMVNRESLSLETSLREQLSRLPAVLRQPGAPLLVFAGEAGSGRRQGALAMATDMHLPLLMLDVALLSRKGDISECLSLLALELKLWPAVLCITGVETLQDIEGRPVALANTFARWLSRLESPVILNVPAGFAWRRLFGEQRGLEFSFDVDSHAQRETIWLRLIAEAGMKLSGEEVSQLAGRFDFTAGQIAATLANSADTACLRSGQSDASATFTDILQCARASSDQYLGSLATKVQRHHGWDDLVLTPVTHGRVREFAAAVRQKHVVFSDWGFASRMGHSGSLVAMFAGASGTGKTMTASVIASELNLDLYKVDLSGMVSKYIGETEKNLDRVFNVARRANAILFFDEADALFGKRSEVKDAHDRYANIETAYLLQKIEAHPGVVILATNIRRNIDDAFSRRLQYVIEFPVPDAQERERLWRCMFPAAAPVDRDIDFGFLARQFTLSGGNIRNLVLDAAFLAARDGTTINMHQIVQALGRLHHKQGKLPSPADFGQYHSLLVPMSG